MVCVLLSLVVGAFIVEAQPTTTGQAQNGFFPSTPNTTAQYFPDLYEAAQRISTDYTGFVFDMKKGPKNDGGTPSGSLRLNMVAENPFLSTLSDNGNSQALATLGPCTGNSPHSHPRSSEISYLIYGQIQFAFVEENQGNNVLRNVTLKEGQTIHIPAGLIHYSQNLGCSPAQFLANFPNRDPGVQTTWASLMSIPNYVLNSATGIPEAAFEALRQYPLAIAPTTGGEECLKKCGLTYDTANAFTGLPPQYTAA